MSDKEIIERVREDIFRIALPIACRLRPEIDIKGAQQAQLLADKILSHPNIAIIDPDAELPEMLESDYGISPYSLNPYSYDAAQQDILKAGWRKTL